MTGRRPQSWMEPQMMQRHWTLAAVLLAMLAGCRQFPEVGTLAGEKVDPQLAAELSALTYPGGEEAIGEDLNMVARRDGRTLHIRSFEPRRLENMLCWVNQQWVGRLDAVEIGEDNTYDLLTFINEHGEHYPVGSFLSPDEAQRVVLVELVDPENGKRHRIVVGEVRRPFF